jgi:quercetin dioxygenase-like cupin family protein
MFAGRAAAQTDGVTSEQLAQGSMDWSEFVNGPADFYTLKLMFQPHTFIDWHIHPGPVFGIVTAGTLTDVYDQLGCKASFGPGAAVYIPRGLTHQDRNDGSEILEVTTTFIVPSGSPLRVPTDKVPAGASCGPSFTTMPPF